MIWIEAEVEYFSEEIELAKDLISNVFYDLGVQGVKLVEPMVRNELDYYNDEKLLYTDRYSVTGYFPKNNYIESKLKYFEETLVSAAEGSKIEYKISYNEVDEHDWEDSWKKYFEPEKITKNIVVKPTWKEYNKNSDDEIIIEIDPGMAFGTGTHPTTFLCVNMIEKYLKSGMKVLDVGTGSGILMIAAAKLGAGYTYGIDIDEVAVEVAESNMVLNKIDSTTYKVCKGDLITTLGTEKFDLVVSNILAEVIIILLDDIKKVVVEGGLFISSGIIRDKSEMVQTKMKLLGFEIVEVKEKEEWISIVGRLTK